LLSTMIETNRHTGKNADCYSAGDRQFMVFTQKIRAALLRPLLILLTKCGINADILTLISLLIGLAACPAYFYSRFFFLLLIFMHVVLDGFDGPLARYQGKASRKGSFTDTMADQIVIVATTITLVYAKVIYIVPGIIYIFVYTVVIAFSMIRNALKIPYSWLVRPRFVIYAWLIVEFYLWPGKINYILWFFITLLILKMTTGFYQIRKKI
jgi:phosphatidylglycerophosphate synthase